MLIVLGQINLLHVCSSALVIWKLKGSIHDLTTGVWWIAILVIKIELHIYFPILNLISCMKIHHIHIPLLSNITTTSG